MARGAFLFVLQVLFVIAHFSEDKGYTPKARKSHKGEDNAGKGAHISENSLYKVKLKNSDRAPVQCSYNNKGKSYSVKNSHS